jgi:hypothetical protein
MSQRLKVQNMVMQMHEKNLVLMNILRDIVENETTCDLSSGRTREDFMRTFVDRAVRRNEIVAEIEDFLRREDRASRVQP